MSAHLMLRHLADSMRVPLGEMKVSDAEIPQTQRIVLKWGALYVPLKWSKNFATRPEIDQCRLNPQLDDIEFECLKTIELCSRICDGDLKGRRHPYFGALTRAEWLRWGWLHADHHLRQFGR
jgi:hypothetical protein